MQHIITRQIGNLRGFSTDSIYLRPSNVADKAINIQRGPDGTIELRRGYQCQIAQIGGAGTGTFDDPALDEIKTVSLGLDGFLYNKLTKQIFFDYDGQVTGPITAINNANPANVQSANHGLITGVQLILRGIVGKDALNNKTYTITVVDANNFTLNGVDGSLSPNYISGGYWSIAFADDRFLTFTIFTDPRFISTNPGWSVGPWSLTPWGAPSGESITCNITVNQAAQIVGNQSNTNTINVAFGHEIASPDVIQFYSSNSVFNQRTVLSFTSTSITFDGSPVSVSGGSYINQFFDIQFGKGFDVNSPFLISDFINIITHASTGVYGLQVNINGDTNYPAAFLQILEPIIIDSNSTFSIDYWYWEKINSTIDPPFPGSANTIYQNSPDFENASMAVFDDVIYIANGLDYPQKYDGQTVYRAGMPLGIRPTVTDFPAFPSQPFTKGDTYQYAITYEQIDNRGHIIEGEISEIWNYTANLTPTASEVTATNIQSTISNNWNTNCAIAFQISVLGWSTAPWSTSPWGAPSSPAPSSTSYGPDINGFYYNSLSVASGYTLKIGDSAYYADIACAVFNTVQNNSIVLNVDAGHGVLAGDIVYFINTNNITTIDFNTNFVTSNSIVATIDSIALPAVIFNTDQTKTIQDLATQIQNSPNIISSIVTGNRQITIQFNSPAHTINSVVTTGGASQPSATITASTNNEVQRIIAAVTPTSITITGSPVSIDPTFIESSAYVLDYKTSIVFGDVAIVNGNQISVNIIPVVVGHTINIGDIVSFLDTSNNIQRRNVTNISSSTITIDGNPISVLNLMLIASENMQPTSIILQRLNVNAAVLESNSALSNNLRINIYRTMQGQVFGTNGQLYLVASIPNNSLGDFSQEFVDGLPDSELGLIFSNPSFVPNPPPISKYLKAFGNQLFFAGGERGNAENSDRVFFSNGNRPEEVPLASNFFNVPNIDDDITGIGVSGSTLVTTKNHSLWAATGNFLTGQINVVQIAPGTNIGCVAHATIAAVGSLMYFVHTNGVYAITDNQLFPTDAFGNPVPISLAIDSIFRVTPFLAQTRYVFKRAVSLNYTKDNQYLLFLPCENSQSTIRTANQYSVILAYDYQEKNWFTWTNMNGAGGMFVIDDDLYFQERRFSSVDGNTANLYKQHRFYRLVDHADHTGPQKCEWRSSWEDLKQPEVRKKFCRCILLMDRVSELLQYNNPIMNFSTYLNRLPNLQNTIAQITQVDNIRNSSWSYSGWGWNFWSGYQDSFITVNLKGGTVAKSIQVGFTIQGINMDIKLAGFQLEVIPENRNTVLR